MSHPANLDLNPNVYSVMGRAAMFMPQNAKVIFAFAKMLLEDFLVWFSTPVEVLFLRRRFGVRAISLVQVVQLVFAALMFAVFFRGLAFDPVFSLFLLASAAFAVYHAYEARAWERGTGTHRHTYSEGDPHPELWGRLAWLAEKCGLNLEKHLSTEKVIRFYEPILLMVSGIFVLPVSKLLGGYLLVSSGACLLKSQIRHQRRVDGIRDLNDGKLTGLILSAMPNRTEEAVVAKPFIAQVAIPRLNPGTSTTLTPLPVANGQTGRNIRVKCKGCGSVSSATRGHPDQIHECPNCGKKHRLPARAEVTAA